MFVTKKGNNLHEENILKCGLHLYHQMERALIISKIAPFSYLYMSLTERRSRTMKFAVVIAEKDF